MLKKYRDQIIIGIMILVFAGLGLYENRNTENEFSSRLMNNTEIVDEENEEEKSSIFVHITGAVVNPGIIELPANSRLNDAIHLAGGTTPQADIDSVNLALKMEDEMKVHVPLIGEIEENQMHSLASQETNSKGHINLNTATKEELMTLPNIGEVKADSIIAYRDESPFKSIEDLKNVSGIGDKTFEQLQELVTVH